MRDNDFPRLFLASNYYTTESKNEGRDNYENTAYQGGFRITENSNQSPSNSFKNTQTVKSTKNQMTDIE